MLHACSYNGQAATVELILKISIRLSKWVCINKDILLVYGIQYIDFVCVVHLHQTKGQPWLDLYTIE